MRSKICLLFFTEYKYSSTQKCFGFSSKAAIIVFKRLRSSLIILWVIFGFLKYLYRVFVSSICIKYLHQVFVTSMSLKLYETSRAKSPCISTAVANFFTCLQRSRSFYRPRYFLHIILTMWKIKSESNLSLLSRVKIMLIRNKWRLSGV